MKHRSRTTVEFVWKWNYEQKCANNKRTRRRKRKTIYSVCLFSSLCFRFGNYNINVKIVYLANLSRGVCRIRDRYNYVQYSRICLFGAVIREYISVQKKGFAKRKFILRHTFFTTCIYLGKRGTKFFSVSRALTADVTPPHLLLLPLLPISLLTHRVLHEYAYYIHTRNFSHRP